MVTDSASAGAAAARIADELRHQYLLTYSADAHKDGRTHSIRVEVPGRNVRARKGFVAE